MELFEFQKLAVKELAPKRAALLAYEMGLGKTAISLTAAQEIEAKKILIICPAIAKFNWKNEISRFFIKKADFFIFSYSELHKIPNQENFDLGIFDECHFLKTPTSQRTKEVLGKRGLLPRCKKAWFLSGTPAPNNASELWTLLYVTGNTRLRYEAFIQHFCETRQIRVGNRNRFQITGTRNETIPELRTLLAPLILRKTKEDVMLEIPPIFFDTFHVEENEICFEESAHLAKYVIPRDRKKEFFERIEREKKIMDKYLVEETRVVSQHSTKLGPVSKTVAYYRRYLGMRKVNALASLVNEELKMRFYDKIVIFAVHQDVIEGLRSKIPGAVTIYGGTPEHQREKNIKRFNTKKKCPAIICNIQAAGTAVNLTVSNQVLFAEMSWVPGENAQAAMRCHRYGQTRPVHVRMAIGSDNLESRIVRVLKRKTQELTQIFDSSTIVTKSATDKAFQEFQKQLDALSQ